MKNTHNIRKQALVLAASLLISAPSLAQEETVAAPAPDASSRLREGSYVAPMASYVLADSKFKTKDGLGGVLALGYRQDFWALEVQGIFTQLSKKNGADDSRLAGFNLGALLFPISSLPGAFIAVAAGGLDVQDYPGIAKDSFSITTLEGGAGYLWGLNLGNYEMALRTEVRYRASRREKESGDALAIDIATDGNRRFDDVLFNIGLQLPLGKSKDTASAMPETAAVVPVADSDQDGVVDDLDQCPDTAAGTPVDDKGCAQPQVPPTACESPKAGEPVSLAGCAAGAVVVLHGVNFETAKSTLTPNAKQILDGVAASLSTETGIVVEIGGHTDAQGSDEYNQRLSEARAQAVVSYLAEHGVSADRLKAAGYGEAMPVADNDSDEGRELNRRVELKIVGAATAATPTSEAIGAPAPAEAPGPAADSTTESGVTETAADPASN